MEKIADLHLFLLQQILNPGVMSLFKDQIEILISQKLFELGS